KDDLKRAPGIWAGGDLLADRGRHGEHARIAAGDHSDARALRRVAERGRRTRRLFAVVGRMSTLAGTRRHAVEIRPVAIKRLRVGERGGGLRGEITRIARSQADHGDAPTHGLPPGRRSQPGTNTTAKYGASSSVLA